MKPIIQLLCLQSCGVICCFYAYIASSWGKRTPGSSNSVLLLPEPKLVLLALTHTLLWFDCDIIDPSSLYDVVSAPLTAAAAAAWQKFDKEVWQKFDKILIEDW